MLKLLWKANLLESGDFTCSIPGEDLGAAVVGSRLSINLRTPRPKVRLDAFVSVFELLLLIDLIAVHVGPELVCCGYDLQRSANNA
jgi:hypothetical protein